MELLPKQPSIKAPQNLGTGDSWVDLIIRGDGPSRVRMISAHFAPCARTGWHTHPVGQTIWVTEGVGRMQARGGDVIEVRAGDVIYTPPDEWHWHGGGPTTFMTHVAVWEAAPDGREYEWGDLVSDDEYFTMEGDGELREQIAGGRVASPW
jgi:quercetin dioxygenase-like cupin family protein